MSVLTILIQLSDRLAALDAEEGFSTAELLANAAMGVAALIVIWGGMQLLGESVVEHIRGLLIGT